MTTIERNVVDVRSLNTWITQWMPKVYRLVA